MFYFANFVSKVETKKVAIIILKDMAQMSKNVIVHHKNRKTVPCLKQTEMYSTYFYIFVSNFSSNIVSFETQWSV